ncbi:MAG: helix-turn-helix domain-containing protein, partial [Conexivisphaerales archaeon]
STYDIKVYLQVAESGYTTAYDINKKAGVPYPKVYESLKRLISRGWVKVEKGRPNRYFPADPEEVLSREKDRLNEQFSSLESTFEENIRPIYEKRGIKEKSDVLLVRGTKNVLSGILSVIKPTKAELKIALPFLPSDYSEFEPIVNIVNRLDDVEVKVLTSRESYNMIKRSLPDVEIRVRDTMFGGGVISDSKMVALIFSNEENKSNYMAIVSDHPYLAIIANSYFEYLWSDSAAGEV